VIKVSVKLDIQAMKRDCANAQKEVNKAAARAINRAADGARTVAKREVSAATKIKISDVNKRLSVTGARPTYLIADLDAHPYSPNLSKFRPTQNAKGVAASAWERRKTYRHAFINPRTGQVVTRTGNERFPLKGLRGPSVPSTFMRPEIVEKIEQAAIARFTKEFESDVTRRLAR